MVLRSLLVFGAVIGAAASAQGAIFTVFVMHDHFMPDHTILVGDTVRWEWMADLHTTTSVAGSLEVWSSGVKSSGETFDHTFTQEGTFNYYCQIHGFDNGNGTASGMSGTITVQAVPEPATLAVLGSMMVGMASRRRIRRH